MTKGERAYMMRRSARELRAGLRTAEEAAKGIAEFIEETREVLAAKAKTTRSR
jgi:cystathionine beta-lyase/cystathionine gamma-synthase